MEAAVECFNVLFKLYEISVENHEKLQAA